MFLKRFLIACMFSIATFAFAQEKQQTPIEAGTVLTIAKPSTANYKHIDFPRKNFIIKRGGIANFKTLYGKKVEVVSHSYSADGQTIVTLRPADGTKFFRNFSTVDAHLEDALSAGELIK
ncbi:hypothetical protein [Muriicola sp.]|uniref:hypothetical protein n=1 Tax=Muriicola sp. TaxID=2020856 RepID=UPI003C750F13